MATPHIAGAMALLWSGIPSLQNQIDASRTALDNAAHFISSTLCGTAGPPNNVYGWGRVDILAAVTSGAPITLSAAGRKVGGINTVRLRWSGATSTNIDVYRNGVVVPTVANPGSYTDSTAHTRHAT